jgi:hypothetical protein
MFSSSKTRMTATGGQAPARGMRTTATNRAAAECVENILRQETPGFQAPEAAAFELARGPSLEPAHRSPV